MRVMEQAEKLCIDDMVSTEALDLFMSAHGVNERGDLGASSPNTST